MLIDRFRQFSKELSHDGTISNRVNKVFLFRYFDKHWYDDSDEDVVEQSLLDDLNKTRNEKVSWRHPSSPHCYYYVEDLDAVIAAEFSSPPKSQKRKALEVAISQCLAHSEDAFKASHCSLTGLSNKSAFDEVADRLVTKLKRDNASGAGEAAAQSHPSLHIVYFDIDYFKQLNDSHGHAYGDLVLKVFARRLQSNKRNLLSGFPSDTTCEIFRMSGEEFSVLLYGPISKEEACGLAENISVLVRTESLPTDQEWHQINDNYNGLTLPPPRERNLTISVGVSSITGVTADDNRKIIDDLSSKSDTAMYAAKNGGRNRVLHFENIIKQHGRVIEHHLETGVVSINIGKNVDVKQGFEFLVFHPDFTGEKPFIHSDGRTQKVMGRYPRLPLARIIVFDVQQELSFCKPAEKYQHTKIPTNSWLELIPIGAIAHYIESGSSPLISGTITGSLISRGALEKDLQKKPNWKKFYCAVFGIRNVTNLIERGGVTAANNALARLYESIEHNYGSEYQKAQVSSTQIAVVGNFKNAQLENDLETVLDRAVSATGNSVVFECGVVAPELHKVNSDDSEKSDINPKYAIQYSQYAISEELNNSDKVIFFDTKKCYGILYSLRRKKESVKVRALYREFSDVNVAGAGIENQMSLVEYERAGRDLTLAEAHAKNATKIGATSPIYHANLGLMLAAQKKYVEAYNSFKSAIDLKYDLLENYKAAYAVAAHYAKIAGQDISTEAIATLFGEITKIAPEKWNDISLGEFKEIAAMHGILF